MPTITAKQSIPSGQVKLTIEIPFTEQHPHLLWAAEQLSASSPLAGFRPGRAPLELARARFGETKLIEKALERLLPHSFVVAIRAEQIDPVGPPRVDLGQVSYGQAITYTATVALLPSIRLPELGQLKLERTAVAIGEAEVAKVLEDLRRLRAKGSAKDGAAENGDLVTIDFSSTMAGVPLENGSAKGYSLLLGEGRMLPGFEPQLVGLKAGEGKKFPLAFPSDYPNQRLAGQTADFEVQVLQVFRRELPELTDELAKDVSGLADLNALRQQIADHLRQEKERDAELQAERNLLESLVAKTVFGEMPALLIDAEVEKMISEFEQSLDERGLKPADYYTQTGGSRQKLLVEFRQPGEHRVQVALALRQVAKEQQLTVDEQTVEQELSARISAMRQTVRGKGRDASLDTPEYRDYLRLVLTNRRVISWLKDWVQQKTSI